MSEFALTSTRVVTPTGEREAILQIRDGKIAQVLPPGSKVAGELLDFGNLAILPGLIDPHVHINEPGRTSWEGFDTATRAALAGGITTLVDMPLNSAPVTTTVANLKQKLAATQNQLHAHCGFWGGLIPGNAAEVEPLIQAGVLGFKAFLTHSGIPDFPNVTATDLRAVMPLLTRHNLPLLVHCELSEPAREPNSDARSYQQYLLSRPDDWEVKAVELMISLCREFNCPTHLVHISSAASLPLIAAAKADELPITAETAPHYLFFNAEEIPDGHPEFKCAPPIRSRANNEQLWQALESGVLDFVATDHSPAPPELKQLESGNLSAAWGGISSLQLSLPIVWTSARERGATLLELVRWLSYHPARLLNLHHQKGKIEAGFDADLLILDPNQEFMVTEELLQHKHKISPYLGLKLQGQVQRTFLKGTEVYRLPHLQLPNQGEIITAKHG